MTLSEFRETYSWQGAIALGPKLITLAEELPGSEENGLSLQLRTLMVELPATIAADLMADRKPALAPVLKLVAIMELIDKVFPALDTADTRTQIDELSSRLVSDNFTERTGGSPAIAQTAPAEPTAPVAAAAAETPVLASEVSITPDSEVAPVLPTIVPVAAAAESEETDVHPDSVQ